MLGERAVEELGDGLRLPRRRIPVPLLARPDVRAALDKVGRPVTTPLAGDYWGGF